MEDQPTCGKGLAEHSVLSGKLGELIGSVADNLEVHMNALDLKDANAKKEHDAYMKLASKHRQLASQLQATAKEMAGYRDLPMGRHDEKAMSAPKAIQAFEKFVKLEQALVALLQAALERDQGMLVEMRAAGGGKGQRP